MSTVDKTSGGSRSRSIAGVVSCVAVVLLSIGAKKTIDAGDPLTYMLPNFMLMTPLHHYVVPVWKFLNPPARLPAQNFKRKQVRSMDAADFTFERLAELTENFRYPGVVRGLFNDTKAVKLWTKKNYLTDKIGDFGIKVMWKQEENTTKFLDNRTDTSFREAYVDLLANEDYKGWLFFPFFTAKKKDRAVNPINVAVNKIIRDDLDIDRIWKGFGNYDTHSSFVGSQFSMGRAMKGQKKGTATLNWHCEPGSNWFVQVSGAKEWWFMDPKYSAYMMTRHSPNGVRVLRTSDGDLMRDLHDQLPLETATLQPGDLLYNPEWEWHTIKKEEGVSIAVAMREFNVTNALKLNAAYTVSIGINHFLKNIGIDITAFQ